MKRVSIFAGLSVLEIFSDADVQAPFSTGIPVVGVGIRDIPYISPFRVNAGVMFFEQDDANPLVDEKVAKRDVFVSVTADFELKNLLGPLFAIIK